MPTRNDAQTRFEQAVAAKMNAAGMTKLAATRAVVSENPQLHQEYLREANANRPRARAQL